VDFVHQQVDFGSFELAAGNTAHVVDDVAGHRVDLIKPLKISGGKPAGALIADIDAMLACDFQGQVMGGLAACGAGLFLKDAFREGAPADIAKANY
jgi:hypothetical protein